MTNTLRERRRQLLRDEILDAAQALLAQKGYAAMSMDELAASVGISKPTLYSHFANKDELAVEAVLRELGRLAVMVEARVDDQSPLERLTHLLRAIIQLQIDQGSMALRPLTPELFHLLCKHQDALGYIRRLDTALTGLVQAGIAAGEIDPSLQVGGVVAAFYSLANAFRFTAATGLMPVDPVASSETMVLLFVRGLQRAP